MGEIGEIKVGEYVRTDEFFKDIVGYEGYYEISNYGTVKSKERYSTCCYGKQRFLKEKIIVPTPDKNGYLRIMLSKNKNKKRFYIHDLVAQMFLNDYNKEKVIHHIDYNNQNNYFKNLYICTRNEHTKLHNKTDRLIRELIEKNIVKFNKGKYYICENIQEQFKNMEYRLEV